MSGPARLLQILPGALVGGIERYALTIGLAAAAEGWDVHAAFADTPENAPLVGAYCDGEVTPHALDTAASGPAPWQVATIATRTLRLVSSVKPDVVHVNVPLPNFGRGQLIGCAVRGVSTVAVFHTAPPGGSDLGRSRRLYPLLHARNQAWVTVSEHDRGRIAELFQLPPEEVTVIPNGVAPVEGGPLSGDERARVRRGLGLPGTALVALSVGRLSGQKGYDYIVAAAAGLAGRHPQLHFVIAGEGEERAALGRLIQQREVEANVHLIGQRDDVETLLRAADLFVFPSRFEGFPFALLEAAAHGLPIICSDIAGVDELVTHRDSALLHPVGDIEALRQALELAVESPDEMRAMGERARLASGRFSREAMVKATLSLLAARAAR